MNSNPTHSEAALSDNQTLYLRLFFKHNALTQEHSELLTSTHTSLNVLQSLIHKFIDRHAIDASLRSPQKGSSEQTIPRSFEEIYETLQRVFEEWPKGNTAKSTQLTQNTTIGSYGDEELYEIVGEYREEVRKQKEAKTRAESTITQLRQQAAAADKRSRQLQAQLKDKDQQYTLCSRQLQQSQEELEQVSKQLIEVTAKVEELKLFEAEAKAIQTRLSNLQGQHELLQKQYLTEKTQCELLTEQLAQTDQMIKERIEEGQERWKKMVAEQLSNPNSLSAVMQTPLCRLVRTLAQRQPLTHH